MTWSRLVLSSLLVAACAPPAPSTPPSESRTVWEGSIAAGCAPADLELVLPFYEGLRLKPAASALRAATSEHLELAMPGPLSMPLVAWRCGEGEWTAIAPRDPLSSPASLLVRTHGDEVDVRLECFGPCALGATQAHGSALDMARTVAARWNVRVVHPPLASKVDRFDAFVRQWVSPDAAPLRVDWSRDALGKRLAAAEDRTMAFVFGVDPHEVDLEGRYFWSDGAMDEAKAIVAASPRVAHLRWLNLRTYKYAVPRLGIERPPPPDVLAAAKVYASGRNHFSQYVFEALEMCTGAEAWQRSRVAELEKLVGLGFRVIALDEFPTSPRWGAEACRATNHLHRPNDFADEWRVTRQMIERLSAIAEAHGVLLASEEPSVLLAPFTSGYMDSAFADPPEMYEHWRKSDAIHRIPLFSTMFGASLTPYTRMGTTATPPSGWLIQRKIPSP